MMPDRIHVPALLNALYRYERELVVIAMQLGAHNAPAEVLIAAHAATTAVAELRSWVVASIEMGSLTLPREETV